MILFVMWLFVITAIYYIAVLIVGIKLSQCLNIKNFLSFNILFYHCIIYYLNDSLTNGDLTKIELDDYDPTFIIKQKSDIPEAPEIDTF